MPSPEDTIALVAPTLDPNAGQAPSQIRRLGWLHFANDFTLDFLTPLLPVGVGIAWIGVMEGLADGIGQVLKLFTGRASDRSGRRAAWVKTGYVVNAGARPLAGLGMLLVWPWWIIVCRITDRIGKGVRGSATDALVADWSNDGTRARAFAHMRTMDHLGATVGGLAAAGTAYVLPADQLGWAVVALVTVTVSVVWLAGGLRDRAPQSAAQIGKVPAISGVAGWWPQAPSLRRPFLAISIATLAVKLSPLLILAQVTGITDDSSASAPPIWLFALGWAGLGLVQAAAASVSGIVTERLGPAMMLRLAWVAAAVVFIGLAVAEGPWRWVVGLGYGIVTGMTEGAEKTWIAELAPTSQRALSFGALAFISAIAALIGNGVGGVLLTNWGPQVFFIMAGAAIVAVIMTGATTPPDQSAGSIRKGRI